MSDLYIRTGMTEDEIEYIKNQLFHFNVSAAPPDQGALSKDINLILKDEDKIYGGLIGRIYRRCLFIEFLWISEEARGVGYGGKLIIEAEKIAITEQCSFVHLDTFSFQAPEFYKKKGYEIFGVLEGYSDGIKRYYLKKDL
ncbi:MAG: GNAT family N-acetyltransferase [Gudongella sp.]|nr:GNAT family N-acetyltransferase [Gudongella sp.]